MNGVAIATNTGVRKSGTMVVITRSGISTIAIGCRASTAQASTARAAAGAQGGNVLNMVRRPGRSFGTRVASTDSSRYEIPVWSTDDTRRNASRWGYLSVRTNGTEMPAERRASWTARMGPPAPEQRSTTAGARVVSRARLSTAIAGA